MHSENDWNAGDEMTLSTVRVLAHCSSMVYQDGLTREQLPVAEDIGHLGDMNRGQIGARSDRGLGERKWSSGSSNRDPFGNQ